MAMRFDALSTAIARRIQALTSTQSSKGALVDLNSILAFNIGHCTVTDILTRFQQPQLRRMPLPNRSQEHQPCRSRSAPSSPRARAHPSPSRRSPSPIPAPTRS
ncbi:hypothetical protein CH279_29480, partial [Rhodococcus sp. 06-412-2B]